MQYAQLGNTDLIVSRICFGCWQLSPMFWGDISLEDWQASLPAAIDAGINFIDTADAYGDGYAESSLGDWLQKESKRDEFYIATKFYNNFEQEQRFPDTSYDYILRECDASLRRLKTDHIDLYQIHAWDPLIRPDEVATAFGQLKKQGKIRWVGVSNWNADQMRMGLRHFDLQCLQPLYNALDRKPEAAEFPLCMERGIGVITYSSLARGLLAGKYTPESTFNDARANNPRFKGDSFKRLLQGIEELQPYADKYELTIAQLAVRWVLTNPAVTSAIVGVKKPEHITSIAPAAEGLLTNEDWHRVANIISRAKSEALGKGG